MDSKVDSKVVGMYTTADETVVGTCVVEVDNTRNSKPSRSTALAEYAVGSSGDFWPCNNIFSDSTIMVDSIQAALHTAVMERMEDKVSKEGKAGGSKESSARASPRTRNIPEEYSTTYF